MKRIALLLALGILLATLALAACSGVEPSASGSGSPVIAAQPTPDMTQADYVTSRVLRLVDREYGVVCYYLLSEQGLRWGDGQAITCMALFVPQGQ